MSFKRGLLWTAIGQAALFAIQFGGAVIVARLLSPFDMGVFALAMAIVGVLNMVQSIGLGSYIVREPDLTPEKVATAFTVNLIISMALAIVTGLLGMFGSALIASSDVRHVLIILAIMPLLNILSIVPTALFERQGRFGTLSMINVIGRLGATAVTVFMAYDGFSFFSVAWGQCAGAFCTTALLCIAARKELAWQMSLSGWREVSRFGMQMIAITGVNALGGRASDLLLGKLTGLAALGLYTRAANMSGLFWENFHLVIGRNVFTELSRQKRVGQSLRPFYLATSEMVTASLWPMFTGLAVLAEPLIKLIYGPPWLPAATPFKLLAIAALIQASVTMTWEIFVACGETAQQARMESIRIVVGLGLFAVGCAISLEAAAASRCLDAVFTALFYGPHLRRMTDTKLADFVPIYLRSGLLTMVAVLPACILIVLAGDAAPGLSISAIAVAVSAGILLWAITLAALRHPLFLQASSLITKRYYSLKAAL